MCSLTMFSHQKLCTFHSCVQTLETLYFRSGKKQLLLPKPKPKVASELNPERKPKSKKLCSCI